MAVARKATKKKAPVKAVAKKAAGTTRKRLPKPSGGRKSNPFDKGTQRHDVAALLMQKGQHSWDELVEAAGGSLSTRVLGSVIVALEGEGLRFSKTRDPEYGTCYEQDPSAPAIGAHDGSDATGDHSASAAAAQRRVKAQKKAPAKKTAAKKTAARKTPAKKVAAKKAPAKKAAPRKATASKVKPRPRKR